ncbi:MAG: LysM peptidoglycan-binding domain-containing protein [Verrucomicrobiota bacterium]|nr:LysM peptidoglycan-binding domain-containing protein [Verrucomicrobiota bacterium]
MKLLALVLPVSAFALALSSSAQSPAPAPFNEKPDATQLETLTKKVDEENIKLDALSQQLLKLEQQVSAIRPGVMIGEPTPPPSMPTAAGTMGDPAKSAAPATGNSHTIAKGETLTSIAKMYKVGVEDLQKFNHIENDRKLQVGQTIMIPAGATVPSASPSASPSPSAP